MKVERITSRKNPLMLQVRKLAASRSYRREQGLYLGDGVKVLEEALRWGADIQTILVSDGVCLPTIPEKVRLVEVPEDVMATISPMESPQGALMVGVQPDLTPPQKLNGSRYLLLDGLQDPGNVGTIWRAADALGADGLLMVHHCADPYSPTVVRATMGACFRLPVYEVEWEALPGLLERSELPMYATALREDTIDIRTAPLSREVVAIGSEGRGVSQELLQISQKTMKIPMRDRCESLNAAVAATVVLWEMWR